MLEGDIPAAIADALRASGRVAVDTETSGLDWRTDSLNLCQLYAPETGPVLVRGVSPTPTRLAEIFQDSTVQKVFHFAPFDLRFLEAHWGVRATSVACTKAASRISDPGIPSPEHSLKMLVRRILGVELDKGSVRTSDWGAEVLTDDQVTYAVADVVHLLDVLDHQLERLSAVGRALDFWNVCAYMPTDAHLRVTGVPNPLEY